MNGHQITASALSQPEHRQKFCQKCGEQTIVSCSSCNEPIRGHYHVPDVLFLGKTPVPKYCLNCGEPYPWQAFSIENLLEIV